MTTADRVASVRAAVAARPTPIVRWTSGFASWTTKRGTEKSGAANVTLTSPSGRYDWTSDRPNARVVGVHLRVDSADDWTRGTFTVSWKDNGGRIVSADSQSPRVRSGIAGQLYVRLPDTANLSAIESMAVTLTGLDKSTSWISAHILSVFTPPSTAPFGGSASTPAGEMFQLRPRSSIAVKPPADVVVASRVAELQAVLDWARGWQRNVVLGEFGVEGGGDENDASWQRLMDEYLDVADAAGVPLLRWSEGAGAPLTFYASAAGDNAKPPAITQSKPVAAMWEGHLRAVPGRAVGVSLFSMCQATTTVGDGKYSNENVGDYGKDFKAENPATIPFLASRGHNAFRLPFRWDRVMRDQNGPLDKEQWGYYRRNVDAVMAQPGAIVVVDPHCSWGYRFPGENRDTNSRVTGPGSPLSIVAYAHLLRLVCADLDDAGYHGRYVVELTNEPHGDALSQWTNAVITQYVVEDLRGDGNDTHLLIPFYPLDAALSIGSLYPWVNDPLGTRHHSYVVHHYFDAQRSGFYNWPPYSKVLERQQAKENKSGSGDGSGDDPGDGSGDGTDD